MLETEHVIIQGDVFLYKDKAPFMSSGASIAGALEYDQAEDKIRCHECGEFFGTLANHIPSHKLSARAYKMKHGLLLKTALVGDRARKSMIAGGLANAHHLTRPMTPAIRRKAHRNALKTKREYKSAYETANGFSACHAQLLEKIRRLSEEKGGRVKARDLEKAGIHGLTLVSRFGSIGAACRLAGAAYKSKQGRKRYSDETLLEALRTFKRMHGRRPYASDIRRGLVGPAQRTFTMRFGSLYTAMEKAGVS